jgi:high-affinity nickel-transport protein
MPTSFALPISTLGIGFLLGMRHGLDPDHVAVIDNLTFRLAGRQSRLAPWVGALFAAGHSLSVAAVAIGVSLVAPRLSFPAWVGQGVDWLLIALLVLVGCLNLRALLRADDYAPIGWRQGLAPKRLLATASPAGIFGIGVVFGLVFDTASQAAAWGLAASTTAGTVGVAITILTFAAGMILTDTADSQIVARLLQSGGDPARVRFYRRAVGWLVVALSFGMAAFALFAKLLRADNSSEDLLLILGGVMAASVIVVLLVAHTGSSRERRTTESAE